MSGSPFTRNVRDIDFGRSGRRAPFLRLSHSNERHSYGVIPLT